MLVVTAKCTRLVPLAQESSPEEYIPGDGRLQVVAIQRGMLRERQVASTTERTVLTKCGGGSTALPKEPSQNEDREDGAAEPGLVHVG
jgi:hypothetical protein